MQHLWHNGCWKVACVIARATKLPSDIPNFRVRRSKAGEMGVLDAMFCRILITPTNTFILLTHSRLGPCAPRRDLDVMHNTCGELPLPCVIFSLRHANHLSEKKLSGYARRAAQERLLFSWRGGCEWEQKCSKLITGAIKKNSVFWRRY